MSRTGDAIIQAMEDGLWEPGESFDPEPCEGCERCIMPGEIRCSDCLVRCDECDRLDATRGIPTYAAPLCRECQAALAPHECSGCLVCAGMRESDF